VNYNQFAIGANYTLSPRTDVYAAGWIRRGARRRKRERRINVD
jgi:predicted porin